MKKTFKTMLALMAGAMTFTGCTSDILENTPEQIPSALKPMTFTATQESDATRAAINGTAINWTAGDKISIFDGGEADEDGNLAREFTLTGDAGKPSGTFTGTAAEATTYYALYPYASSTYEENGVKVDGNYLSKIGIGWQELSGYWDEYHSKNPEKSMDDFIEGVPLYSKMSAENKAIIKAYLSNEEYKEITKSGVQRNGESFTNVVFPAAQTATVGSADPKAMLMIGTSDNTNNIQFKNVCAYLKVTPTFACSSIVFKSNGTESLAGTVTLDYNEGNPTTAVTNGTNTVTLSGTIAANSTYYIAVLPATLATGFTIEFKDASDKILSTKSATKNVTFARNKVINLGSFDAAPTPPEGSVGTAKRTGEIDVNWVQLWENGPKFAEYNIGAENNKAEDCGGYYGWNASTAWGSAWRMPTNAELTALLANCTCTWDDTKKGLLCKGKGDYAANSIFLPAAGYQTGSVIDQNVYGYYWSSVLSRNEGEIREAWTLKFGSDNSSMISFDSNYSCPVRAVLKEAPATTGTAKATINSVETDVNWVQLWADGPKFAEFNVGAANNKAEDYGGYFAWATNIAENQWGSEWRMPTKEELQALISSTNCTVTWKEDYNGTGINGCLFTGQGDYASNSIFLPAAGHSYYGGSCKETNAVGCYWSSTIADYSPSMAEYLNFSSSGPSMDTKDNSSFYLFVRAVLK